MAAKWFNSLDTNSSLYDFLKNEKNAHVQDKFSALKTEFLIREYIH